MTTLAGSSLPGFADGPAALAQFSGPSGIVLDAAGVVYVADTNNSRIRKVTPDGAVSTLAGSGRPGFADGPSAAAQFNFPIGVAVDAAGVVYVADPVNNRIRKITPDGTLAGSGKPGFADGPAAAAQLNFPAGVAVDASGVVYIGDAQNHRIRKLTPDGTVSTLAGSGKPGSVDGPASSAQFFVPQAVIVDSAGAVYVADDNSNRIRKVTPDGTVSTLAGSGPGLGYLGGGYADGSAASAQFSVPESVAVDAAGVVYVADSYNSRIRKVTLDGTVSTLAGSGVEGFADGPAESAQFYHPNGVAVDATGAIYVADSFNSRIRKIAPAAAMQAPAAPAGLQATALDSVRLRFRWSAGSSLQAAPSRDGQVGPLTQRLLRAYMNVVGGVGKRVPDLRMPAYRAVGV